MVNLYKIIIIIIIMFCMDHIFSINCVPPPPGGIELIISVGDYVDNSFTALGSSDPREIRLKLLLCFYVFHFRFVQVHFFFVNCIWC